MYKSKKDCSKPLWKTTEEDHKEEVSKSFEHGTEGLSLLTSLYRFTLEWLWQ